MYHSSVFSRTLGVLLAGGLPVVQALEVVQRTSPSERMKAGLREVTEQVRAGGSLHLSLDRAKLLDPLAVEMVRVGEQSSALPEMLDHVADFFDQEVEKATTAVTTLIGPILILFMGVVVLALLLAVYVPLFNAGNVVQVGGYRYLGFSHFWGSCGRAWWRISKPRRGPSTVSPTAPTSFSAFQHLALGHAEPLEVGVEREPAAAVVEDHHGAVALVEVGEDHAPFRHRLHGRPQGGLHQEPALHGLRVEFRVQMFAEALGQGAGHGLGEFAPQACETDRGLEGLGRAACPAGSPAGAPAAGPPRPARPAPASGPPRPVCSPSRNPLQPFLLEPEGGLEFGGLALLRGQPRQHGLQGLLLDGQIPLQPLDLIQLLALLQAGPGQHAALHQPVAGILKAGGEAELAQGAQGLHPAHLPAQVLPQLQHLPLDAGPVPG